MPSLIGSQLVRNRRAGANQRHFSLDNIEELRKFVQAGPPQELAKRSNAPIGREFVNRPSLKLLQLGI